MSCQVLVTRGVEIPRTEPCGHGPEDHLTMIDAEPYCRACFSEVGTDLGDTAHTYSNGSPTTLPPATRG